MCEVHEDSSINPSEKSKVSISKEASILSPRIGENVILHKSSNILPVIKSSELSELDSPTSKPEEKTREQVDHEGKPYFSLKMDRLREKAGELAHTTQTYSDGKIPKELRDEVNMIKRERTNILWDYFKQSITTNAGKDIIAFMNPALPWEDIEIKHRIYVRYAELDKSIPPRHDTEHVKLRDSIISEMRPLRQGLEEFGVSGLTHHFADTYFTSCSGF